MPSLSEQADKHRGAVWCFWHLGQQTEFKSSRNVFIRWCRLLILQRATAAATPKRWVLLCGLSGVCTYPENTQHLWRLPLYDPQPSPFRHLKPADTSAVKPKGVMRIANKRASKAFTAIYSCWKRLVFWYFRHTRAQLSCSQSCRKVPLSLFLAALLEPNRTSPLTRNIFSCAEQKTEQWPKIHQFTTDLSASQCFLD